MYWKFCFILLIIIGLGFGLWGCGNALARRSIRTTLSRKDIVCVALVFLMFLAGICFFVFLSLVQMVESAYLLGLVVTVCLLIPGPFFHKA